MLEKQTADGALMNQFRALLGFSIVLIGGCLGAPNDGDDAVNQTGTTTLTDGPDQILGSFANSSIPSSFHASNCIHGTTGPVGPQSVFKTSTPPGWEESAPGVGGYNWELYSCERVSWGNFERGLVFLLFEEHGDFDAPESCLQDTKQGVLRMLATFWISDPDLADFVNRTYDIPVFTGNFTLDAEVGPPNSFTWQWGVEGQPRSELVFYHAPLQSVHSTTFWTRTFFYNGTATSYFDIDDSAQSEGPLAVRGTVRAPMASAASGLEYFANSGQTYFNATLDGTIHQFTDFQCTPRA